MEFVEEEEWEKKIQSEGNAGNADDEMIGTSYETTNPNSTLTIPIVKKAPSSSRRHSSILLKHGLEVLEDNETDMEDKSVKTNTTQNTTQSDEDSTNDIFLSLSVKELKKLIQLKCQQYPEETSNQIKSTLSTICSKEELREFCKQHVDRTEVSQLLQSQSSDSSPHSTIPSPSPSTPSFSTSTSTSTLTQFSHLTIQQIKQLLKTRATEIPSEDSQHLLHSLSVSVEKKELLQLCQQYLSSEAVFERLCKFLQIPLQKDPEESSTPPVNDEDSEEDETGSDSRAARISQRKENFRKMLNLTALDDGSSLRGMLFKKGRGRTGFLKPWNERFFILNYTMLTLRYYDINGSTARSLNIDRSLPPEETLKGEISINGCTAKSLPFSSTGKSYSFQVLVNDAEVIVLAAQNEADQFLWMEKLTEATQQREKAVNERRKKYSVVSPTGPSMARQRTSRTSRTSLTREESDESASTTTTATNNTSNKQP